MIKRCALMLAAALVLLVAMHTRTHAARPGLPESFLVREYSVTVVVDDLLPAFIDLLAMPGMDLSSDISVAWGTGHMIRSLTPHELPAAMAILRDMGDIITNTTHSRNEFAAYSALRAELDIRVAEHERLVEHLHEAETILDFRQVERRMVVVIEEIEFLRGRLSRLELDLRTVLLHISVWEQIPEDYFDDEEEEEEEIPETASERIARVFRASATGSLAVLQAILVFVVYISVPGAIAFVTLGVLWLVIKYAVRRTNSPDVGLPADAGLPVADTPDVPNREELKEAENENKQDD